jgi:hypothetical protein
MFKKKQLPIPIVKSRYLLTIGRLIGKTDGCLLQKPTRIYIFYILFID